ncbi:alginate export family protein [Algoriphagus sp.]|uniref:alginate export family protein n=1 Tax=Algoriphagus sp. TaxID=1872435 RepID=UPI003F6E9A8D
MDTIESKSIYQNIKEINLFPRTTLSFGGSWRFQTESFINGEFDSQVSQDNIWYLNRFLIHTHLNVGKSFELFAEVGSSLVTDKEDVSPIDKNELYVNQLFAKYQFTPRWGIAGGRYNMRLGSGRLVDIREGPNVRRSFDFVEFNYHTNNFKAQTFFSIPVKSSQGVFNNDYLNFDETFSGVYTTTSFSGSTNLDAYALYQKENEAIYESGKKNERRASLGIRHFGNYKKLTYNNEAVYQFGKFGDQTISAWTLSINVEREVNLVGKIVNLGLKTEAISGDKDTTDNKLNTFDALYPRGAYFGRVARFGPSNLIDVHPYINTYFHKLEVSFDYAAFWRYSLQDGVYGPALTLDYPAVGDGRFIAHQIGTILSYRLSKFVFLEFESNVIFPGEFLQTNAREDTLYHFVFTSDIKF